jgi:hypothetical protein
VSLETTCNSVFFVCIVYFHCSHRLLSGPHNTKSEAHDTSKNCIFFTIGTRNNCIHPALCKKTVWPINALLKKSLTLYSLAVTLCSATLNTNSFPFCLQTAFLCFVRFSGQRATISLCRFNWSFVTVRCEMDLHIQFSLILAFKRGRT